MARSTVKKQIGELDSAARDYPEYRDLLNLQKAILEILIMVAESSTKGTTEAFSDETVKDLLDKAVASKRPMISFLDASFFDSDTVLDIVKEITRYLMHRSPETQPLEDFLEALFLGEVDTHDAVKAILEEDAVWFQQAGDKFGVDPSLLLLIFDSPLRPFFEELARRVEKELIETWWEPFCPVCGRQSSVARMRKRKRYMICTYCGAQYMVDLFLCTRCGNNDPNTLGFIAFEDYAEYELGYCEKCKNYVKVIYEDRLKRKIPQGLEDILTRELDVLAEGHELGLVRT